MAYNLSKITFKLQKAINSRGHRLLFNNSQFFSDDKGYPITIYHIKDSVLNPNGKYESVELFSSPSHLQIVLFLRDYWYAINGIELPTDNEIWNKIREEKCSKVLPITVEDTYERGDD